MNADEAIFVLNDDTEELHPLECGEALPPVTEFVDVVDDDNPVQYTREQLLFQVLDLITPNTRTLVNSTALIRLANQHVDLILRGNDASMHPWVTPIVKGLRSVVVPEDAMPQDDVGRRQYQEDFIAPITMKSLLDRRASASRDTPFLEAIKKAHHIERLFVEGVPDLDWPSFDFKVPVNLRGRLYHEILQEGKVLQLFGPTNLYTGDIVQVVGFVFSPPNHNGRPFYFNTEEYRSKLAKLVVGDSVIVWQGASERSGTVVERTENTIKVQTRDLEIDLDTHRVWLNTAFVYKKGGKGVYHKRIAIERGVFFSLLQGDEDGKATLQMMLPNADDALWSLKKVVSLKAAFDYVQSHGFSADKLNPKSIAWLAKTLQANLSRVPAASHDFLPATTFSSTLDLGPVLNFEGYAPYSHVGRWVDTRLHRIKHLTQQGDAGMIYLLTEARKNLDRVHAAAIKVSKRIQKGAGSCSQPSSYTRRKFKDWSQMQAQIGSFKDGDLVELAKDGAAPQTYVRFMGRDGQPTWVKYTMQPKEFACGVGGLPVTLQELKKLACTYDALEGMCRTFAAARDQHSIAVQQARAQAVERIQDFLRHKDSIVKDLESLLKRIASTLEASRALATGPSSEVRFDAGIDYTDYEGDASYEDVDALYNQQETGAAYLPLPPRATPSGTDQGTDESDDPYVSTMVKSMGLSLPAETLKLIATNLHAHFSISDLDAKLEVLRAAINKKAATQLERKLAGENKPNVATRAEMAAKARKWAEAKFLEKKMEMEAEAGASHRQKALAAVAWISVMTEIAGVRGSMEFVHMPCVKMLPGGAVTYVACVAKQVVDDLSDLTPQELAKEVQRIVENNPQLHAAYERARSVDVEATSMRKDFEWPEFRPLLQAPPKQTTISKFLKSIDEDTKPQVPKLKQTSRKSWKPMTKIAKHTFEPLKISLTSKEITLEQVEILMPSSQGVEEGDGIGVDAMPPAVTKCLNDKTDACWEKLADDTYNLFKILAETLPMNTESVQFVAQHILGDAMTLHTRNVMRAFLSHELKALLGKVVNGFKTGDELMGDPQVTNLILDIEAVPDLSSQLKASLTADAVAALGAVSKLSVSDPVRHIYAMTHVLVYILYKSLAPVNKNKANPFDILDLSRAPQNKFKAIEKLCNLILSRCVASLQRNTFVAKDILHTQEVLRESRKESIIEGIERLNGEERRTFLEARRLNLRSWEDLPAPEAPEEDVRDDAEYANVDEDDDDTYEDGDYADDGEID